MTTTLGEQAQASGRLLKTAIQGPTGATYNILTGYGWANSDTNSERAWRTNGLVAAARLEERELLKTPTFLLATSMQKSKTFPTSPRQ